MARVKFLELTETFAHFKEFSFPSKIYENSNQDYEALKLIERPEELCANDLECEVKFEPVTGLCLKETENGPTETVGPGIGGYGFLMVCFSVYTGRFS